MLNKILRLIVLILFSQQFVTAQNNYNPPSLNNINTLNPLAKFSNEWNKEEYGKFNTAKDIKYLSNTERNVIWILNMVRRNPVLFLNSVLLDPKSDAFKTPKERSSYYNSLVADLKILSPNQTPLMPDSNLFVSAKCHAYESGKTGYVGHDRKKNSCIEDFYGECCYYGLDDPFVIVISLLIDEKIRSLGHRKIMLSKAFSFIGVSTQPHIDYGTNTVLDFK
jgi:hypothetical protein